MISKRTVDLADAHGLHAERLLPQRARVDREHDLLELDRIAARESVRIRDVDATDRALPAAEVDVDRIDVDGRPTSSVPWASIARATRASSDQSR